MEKASKDVKEKGALLFREGKMKKEIETDKRIHFKVEGETEEHSVIYDKASEELICDCKWSSLKKGVCSHIYCVRLFLGKSEE
jgi:hypothetical protein